MEIRKVCNVCITDKSAISTYINTQKTKIKKQPMSSFFISKRNGIRIKERGELPPTLLMH